ncbi:MAG: VCBS repeat-containing protein, partial [Deltaproteobacteria bacterium]|nr:VCBS repeat-containing protein [Deltaproteobacteria bacterium]
ALPDEAPPCSPTPEVIADIAPQSFAAPTLTDWDGDGDLDLFVGMKNGALQFYRNEGSARRPAFRLSQSRFLGIDTGGNLAPQFLDVNGDGLPDLVLGNSTNQVSLYTVKDGNNRYDLWKENGNLLSQERFRRGLRRAVATLGDVDGDKDLDLMLGDEEGNLMLFRNLGNAKEPAWAEKPEFISGKPSRANTAPWLADIDGDGDLDLLVGGEDGLIWFFRNTGTPKEPKFVLENPHLARIDVGNDSRPLTLDLDGDGDLDLLVGNSKGYIVFYRNEGSKTEPVFTLASTRYGNMVVRQNAIPALMDWDGDKIPDLVVGNREGRLFTSLNRSGKDQANPRTWDVLKGSLEEFMARGYAAPVFADLNGDGTQDLLLGDGEGNLQLWWNRGKKVAATRKEEEAPVAGPETDSSGVVGAMPPPLFQQGGGSAIQAADEAGVQALGGAPADEAGPLPPEYILVTEKFGDFQFQGKAVPAFGDLDGDGDLDLVVGFGAGHFAYYRNMGTPKEPRWEKSGDDSVINEPLGLHPSVVLHDLDGDKKLDLLVGDSAGFVRFYHNASEGGILRFERVPEALKQIRVSRNAAPAVLNIDEDDTPDLLVGDLGGKLLAFLGKGKSAPLQFVLQDRTFARVDVGISATPFVADADRDGALDLLIGSDNGQVVRYVRTTADKNNPWGWKREADVLKNMKFPSGSTPRLADLDADGDLDLFIGIEQGRISYYRNDALKEGQ